MRTTYCRRALLFTVVLVFIGASSAMADPIFVETVLGTYSVYTNPANGHQYALTHTPKFWDIARDEAQTLGGYLTAINDAAENAWVLSTFGPFVPAENRLWLGGSHIFNVGPLHWESGEPFVYQNWVDGEPNNLGQYTVAIHMLLPQGPGVGANGGRWNDVDWGSLDYGVMEFPDGIESIPEPNSFVLLTLGLAAGAGMLTRRARRGSVGVDGMGQRRNS